MHVVLGKLLDRSSGEKIFMKWQLDLDKADYLQMPWSFMLSHLWALCAEMEPEQLAASGIDGREFVPLVPEKSIAVYITAWVKGHTSASFLPPHSGEMQHQAKSRKKKRTQRSSFVVWRHNLGCVKIAILEVTTDEFRNAEFSVRTAVVAIPAAQIWLFLKGTGGTVLVSYLWNTPSQLSLHQLNINANCCHLRNLIGRLFLLRWN